MSRTEQPVITVVYGQKRLIAVYEDGNLIATHDKHTLGNGDFKRALAGFEKRAEVEERLDGHFKRFAEIPKELDKVRFPSAVEEKPPEETPVEGPKGPVPAAAGQDRPAPLKAPVQGEGSARAHSRGQGTAKQGK